MPFLDLISDLCSSPVTTVMFAISCYVGPRYNGTQLYMHPINSGIDICNSVLMFQQCFSGRSALKDIRDIEIHRCRQFMDVSC